MGLNRTSVDWEVAAGQCARTALAGTRREDAGEQFGPDTEHGPIPVPPKYTSGDFTRKEYWAHRGKLDVPKERFILYPDAHRATDPTPVLGWAGWDHAQQALALDQLLQRGEAAGWDEERLRPLVAGLAELLPWVRQWHADPDPFYPAMVLDPYGTVLLANRACTALFGADIIGTNLTRRFLADPVGRQAIANWPEVAWAGLDRLRHQLDQARPRRRPGHRHHPSRVSRRSVTAAHHQSTRG